MQEKTINYASIGCKTKAIRDYIYLPIGISSLCRQSYSSIFIWIFVIKPSTVVTAILDLPPPAQCASSPYPLRGRRTLARRLYLSAHRDLKLVPTSYSSQTKAPDSYEPGAWYQGLSARAGLLSIVISGCIL